MKFFSRRWYGRFTGRLSTAVSFISYYLDWWLNKYRIIASAPEQVPGTQEPGTQEPARSQQPETHAEEADGTTTASPPLLTRTMPAPAEEPAVEPAASQEIVVFSFDYDGCGDIFSEELYKLYEADKDSEDPSEAEDARCFFERLRSIKLRIKTALQEGRTGILLCGSNRQWEQIDETLKVQNRNGSVRKQYQRFCQAFAAEDPTVKLQSQADLVLENSAKHYPESLQAITKVTKLRFESYLYHLKQCFLVSKSPIFKDTVTIKVPDYALEFDKLDQLEQIEYTKSGRKLNQQKAEYLIKISTVLMQMHSLASQHPSQKTIDFHFYDDREDILAMLAVFFGAHPEYIPTNMRLSLHQFDNYGKVLDAKKMWSSDQQEVAEEVAEEVAKEVAEVEAARPTTAQKA